MKYLLQIFLGILSIFFSAVIWAKQIPLYEQPKNDLNPIGNIDLASGYIPIFSPKDGQWMKVADPKNGNVGWVKLADVGQRSPHYVMTQQIITHDGKNYQIINNGQVQQLSATEAAPMIKRMQAEQKSFHQQMHKSMESMLSDMDHMFNHQWHAFNFPFILPVVVVPQPVTKTAENKTNLKMPVKPAQLNQTDKTKS